MGVVLLVEHYKDDYYKIISSGSAGYVAKENQKIIKKFNWITGKNKNDLIWDDKNEKIIETPESILIEERAIKLLREKNQELLKNLYKLISESENLNDLKSKVGM